MQIMTAKTKTLRTLYVHVVLNSAIFHKFSILFYMLDTFYQSSLFLKYYFNKLCFELPQT